jgi:hypothetical protein
MNKGKISIGIGVGLVILLLAGTAYLLPALLAGKAGQLPGFLTVLGGSSNKGEVDVSLIPAPELPHGAPQRVGNIANVQDNSIFVTPRDGGSIFEVVVTKDTKIWQDDNSNVRKSVASSSGGSIHVQEVVAPIGIAQIIPDDDVLIWGESRGGRMIADAVLLRGMNKIGNGTAAPSTK